MANALIRRLRRNLADLIDPESGRRDQAPAARSLRYVSAETLRDRLRRQMSPGAKHGHVNLVSLARIQDRLGAQWPHYAVNADQIARSTIERYLLPSDIYARWKDEGYIVVFSTLDAHEAQIKCMMIGDEIARKLLGEEATDLADVRGVEVKSDGDLRFVPLAGFEELVALTINDAHPVPGAGEDGSSAGSGNPSFDIMAALAHAGGGEPTDRLAELRYSYRPSWDPARGVLAAYLCHPELPEGLNGRWRSAGAVLGSDHAVVEQLDLAVLDHVIDVLDDVIREKRRLLITAPVSFETLSSAAHRRRYLDRLTSRLTAEQAKLLVIELVSVPDGVLQARLLEIVTPLRANARAVIARLRPDTAEFAQFTGARIAAVGCDISRQSGPELALMQQIARFSRGAAKAGVATYLRGIPSLSLVTAALGAGFAHVDGDAIAAAVDVPRGIVEFNLFDLYNPSGHGVTK